MAYVGPDAFLAVSPARWRLEVLLDGLPRLRCCHPPVGARREPAGVSNGRGAVGQRPGAVASLWSPASCPWRSPGDAWCGRGAGMAGGGISHRGCPGLVSASPLADRNCRQILHA